MLGENTPRLSTVDRSAFKKIIRFDFREKFVNFHEERLKFKQKDPGSACSYQNIKRTKNYMMICIIL